MNNWHSIRLLLIGAVAVVIVASYASSFNQAAYSYGDRNSNNGPQDCKATLGKDGSSGVSGTSGTSTAGIKGQTGSNGLAAAAGPNAGKSGEAGTSGTAGAGGIVNGGIGGYGGKGGTAKTICLIISPELTIPSFVPIDSILSRPNWNNAVIAAEGVADRIR